MPRVSFTISRLSPTSPSGCVHFTGSIQIIPHVDDEPAAIIGQAYTPDEVLTFDDEHAAARVALWLNVIGGAQERDGGLWQHLPYIIHAGRAA